MFRRNRFGDIYAFYSIITTTKWNCFLILFTCLICWRFVSLFGPSKDIKHQLKTKTKPEQIYRPFFLAFIKRLFAKSIYSVHIIYVSVPFPRYKTIKYSVPFFWWTSFVVHLALCRDFVEMEKIQTKFIATRDDSLHLKYTIHLWCKQLWMFIVSKKREEFSCQMAFEKLFWCTESLCGIWKWQLDRAHRNSNEIESCSSSYVTWVNFNGIYFQHNCVLRIHSNSRMFAIDSYE